MSEQSFFTDWDDGDEIEVFFDYDPPQEQINTGSSMQPGYPAQIRINRVMLTIGKAGRHTEIQVSAAEEKRLIELAFEDMQERYEANEAQREDA